MSLSKRAYFDYASATPLLPAAAKAMRQAERFIGNPGAIHAEGVEAKAALTDARERLAKVLGCKARELIFTSGLTEANNLAIVGYARALERVRRGLGGSHWIVSAIEHASVLESFAEIERQGGEVSFVAPDEKGIVRPERVFDALRPHTVFVSVGWANNEIGTIQPLAKITETLRAHQEQHGSSVIFHADAGQAPLYEPTVVHSLGVDLLSLSASKLYGPHGIGALYLSNRAQLAATSFGGEQERELRAGTENVALAAGFAAAFEIVAKERESQSKRLRELRGELAQGLAARLPGLIVNGDLRYALPHMLNISIPNVDAEYLTLALDRRGFSVSTKSACEAGEKASHVVEALLTGKQALGGEAWRAEHTLRISLGRDTKKADCTRFAEILPRLAARAIVPAWTSRN